MKVKPVRLEGNGEEEKTSPPRSLASHAVSHETDEQDNSSTCCSLLFSPSSSESWSPVFLWCVTIYLWINLFLVVPYCEWHIGGTDSTSAGEVVQQRSNPVLCSNFYGQWVSTRGAPSGSQERKTEANSSSPHENKSSSRAHAFLTQRKHINKWVVSPSTPKPGPHARFTPNPPFIIKHHSGVKLKTNAPRAAGVSSSPSPHGGNNNPGSKNLESEEIIYARYDKFWITLGAAWLLYVVIGLLASPLKWLLMESAENDHLLLEENIMPRILNERVSLSWQITIPASTKKQQQTQEGDVDDDEEELMEIVSAESEDKRPARNTKRMKYCALNKLSSSSQKKKAIGGERIKTGKWTYHGRCEDGTPPFPIGDIERSGARILCLRLFVDAQFGDHETKEDFNALVWKYPGASSIKRVCRLPSLPRSGEGPLGKGNEGGTLFVLFLSPTTSSKVERDREEGTEGGIRTSQAATLRPWWFKTRFYMLALLTGALAPYQSFVLSRVFRMGFVIKKRVFLRDQTTTLGGE